MKKDEGLKKAFQDLLPKGQDIAHVSADVLCRAIANFDVKLSVGQVEKIIFKLKPKRKDEEPYLINSEEFVNIMKLLKEPTALAQWRKISQILGRVETEEIVLYGKSGVGKTWMARKAAARAVRQRKFDYAIWVYLNRIYEGLSLQESIAYQLSVLAAFEKSEAEEAKKKEEAEKNKTNQDKPEGKKEEEKVDRIETKIQEKLRGKDFLLILDDEGSKMKLDRDGAQVDENDNENRFLLALDGNDRIDLRKILGLHRLGSYKVLITAREKAITSRGIKIAVTPLTEVELKSFGALDEIYKSGGELKDLADFFISKSGSRFPADVLLIERLVSYFAKTESGLQKLRSDKEILEKEKDLKVRDVLIRKYERLPKNVLIDCYSSETPKRHFLHRGGIVNFNELISYWIMEEHLGHFDRIEDAYEEGHRVLMELIDCGLLQKQDADNVASGVAPIKEKGFNFDILDRDEFFRRIHSGLAITFDMKLGRVALAEGMIKTISSSGQDGERLSALLLDGNRIGEASTLVPDNEEPPASSSSDSQKKDEGPQDELRIPQNDLEILAIFNPTRQHFELPIFKMRKLRLLVLRGCKYLDSIVDNPQQGDDQHHRNSQSSPSYQTSKPSPSPCSLLVTSEKLEKLTALEISGPSSLKMIPEILFKNMPNLKNLNMSSLQIELLPQSFYDLTKIEFLILRGCSSFRELGTLKNFKELQVLDISKATSFAKFHDKSLHTNDKLQILNLSQTSIKTLPLVNSLHDLKFISVKGCTELLRLRKIERLTRLQILDVSGAKHVEEFCDPSLEDLKIVILDVSQTAIKRLPANIGCPRYLYVKGCLRLRVLPPMEGLSKVEVLDLSESSNLEEIRHEFFDDLKALRELNLSKTKVKRLKFLSQHGTLRRLELSECRSLEEVIGLSYLKELEFLDLSGCESLEKLEAESFDGMDNLQCLKLSRSGIQQDKLPPLAKLKNLKELYVRDCPELTKVPGLEELPALEILDHVGTFLETPPSFNNPDLHPRVFGVSIKNIDHQELLKKLGASTAEVTSDKSESTDHQQPEQNNGELTEEDKQCKWSISNWQGEENKEMPAEPVHGINFLQLLKKYPSLITNFSRFHFLVYPTDANNKLPDESSYRFELSLRDIYLEQVNKFPQQKLEKCLEIREFDDFPPSLGHLVTQAEFVLLIDNPVKSLRKLAVDSIKAMKACWIERCDELEHVIISEKVEGDNETKESANNEGDRGKNFADILESLEILWVSDATKLRSIFSREIKSTRFKSLKSLYLEYCPQLSEICFSSLQLESLEILYVKYCQNLKTLFLAELEKQDDSAKLEKQDDSAKQERRNDSPQLVKLTELHLWGLEQFQGVACSVPSLNKLRVGECPMLDHVINASMEDQENKAETKGHHNLEVLHIKFCDNLKTIYESPEEPYFENLKELELLALPALQNISCTAPSLLTLKVGECPSLENIVGATGLCRVPTYLETLEVKACDKLKKIIEDGTPELKELKKMELLGLPELERIGASLPDSPETINGKIWACPKLHEKPELVQEQVHDTETPESYDATNPTSSHN